MENSVDPDEMVHNKPSHLDLHCLHKYFFWSVRLKGLKILENNNNFMRQNIYHDLKMIFTTRTMKDYDGV